MTRPLPPIAEEDRRHILEHTAALWPQLAGARLFVTGATGFYGKWLLESLITANDRLGTGIRAILLSRNPTSFRADVPHLATRPEFEWLIGDVTNFVFPPGNMDYVFHFATTPAAKLGAGETAPILADLVGTERVLRYAREAGAKRLLYASSGAIYGPQPAALEYISEDYCGAPDPSDPQAAYAEVKRMGEQFCVHSGVDCVIARGFSFIGPYLPLTDKFAAGSFIRDALAGGPIRVTGDGSPVRAFLYAAELPVWLFTLLIQGSLGCAYNIGSDVPTTIGELALAIARTVGKSADFAGSPRTGETGNRYLPNIDRARGTLGLDVRIPLDSAITRTLQYHRDHARQATVH